jgi:predicted acylesterase/phospholipase RssA
MPAPSLPLVRGGRPVRQTLGMVLSGGAARAAFQVGVYERLLDDPAATAATVAP